MESGIFPLRRLILRPQPFVMLLPQCSPATVSKGRNNVDIVNDCSYNVFQSKLNWSIRMYDTFVKDSLYLRIFFKNWNNQAAKKKEGLKLNVYFSPLCCICFLSEWILLILVSRFPFCVLLNQGQAVGSRGTLKVSLARKYISFIATPLIIYHTQKEI